MSEVDLEKAFLTDRLAPLPGEPDAQFTLNAVRHKVSLGSAGNTKETRRDDPVRSQILIGISGLATALGTAWLLCSTGQWGLFLTVCSIEVVALMTLVTEEAQS